MLTFHVSRFTRGWHLRRGGCPARGARGPGLEATTGQVNLCPASAVIIPLVLLLTLAASCGPGPQPAPPTREQVPTEAAITQTRQPAPSVPPSTRPADTPPPTGGAPAGGGGEIDVSQLVETDDDILGIGPQVPGPHAEAMAAGARVVNLEPMNTFFVLWVPEGYESMETRRVMVIAHGHGGNAYREVGLELEFAQEHGYAIVAIQWWTGVEEVMYSAQQFYEFMDVALRYMAYKYHAQLGKCALRGWSFGSEISFEVTYLDRINGANYLALTISHDGGMMPDPSGMAVGREFVTNLYNGVYGQDAFEGKYFYLYAGQRGQAENMRNTAEVITNLGGVVERLVEDVDAGHDGFYRHPQYHEEALEIFFRLAP